MRLTYSIGQMMLAVLWLNVLFAAIATLECVVVQCYSVTNDAGDVTDTRAFGGVTNRTGTTALPFQYVGRKGYYFDMATGKFQIRRRPYRSTVARWLSVDPAGTQLRFHPYEYALSNPLRFIDPTGLWCAPLLPGNCIEATNVFRGSAEASSFSLADVFTKIWREHETIYLLRSDRL